MPFLRTALLALGSGVFASVAALLVACNSSGTVVPPVDASTDVSEEVVFFDGPTPFEAGATDAGGEAAPSSDAAAFGFIQFKQVPVGGGEFTAAFYGTPLPPPPGCTSEVTDAGVCVVTTCPSHPATDAGVVSLVSAGALTVTGGAFGDAGVEIGPDNLGSYLYNTTGPMFSAGDTLTVSGAGATVPAFGVQTIVAPGDITLTSPTPDSGTLVVPTTQDLALTWTGGVTGAHVIVDLSAFFTSGASASTLCSWDASAGQGTIPASALAPLAAGTPQAGRSGAVWYQQAESSFASGRWTISVRAFVNGGSLASFE